MAASLAVPEVASALQKDFVLLKLDVDRTIGGKDIQKRFGAEQAGLPWFVFLDGEGKVIVNSNGPQGNIGCPWKDEEVAYFGEMLRKAASRLSAADIQSLLEALPCEARQKPAQAKGEA